MVQFCAFNISFISYLKFTHKNMINLCFEISYREYVSKVHVLQST